MRPARSMILFRRPVLGLLVVGLAGLGLVAWWWLTAPPGRPPAYTDDRPQPQQNGYVAATHAVTIAAPPEVVSRWVNEPGRRLEEIVRFDDGFPAVVATEPVRGDWVPGQRVGDRRRVTFADGHHLAEEVLVDDDRTFRYLIWGFTGPQRVAVDHGLAEFRYEDAPGGTRLSWTYSFRPTTPVIHPFVRGFVDDTMRPMMTATLAAMRDGVEAEHRPR